MNVSSPDDSIINEVPLLGSGMHPRGLVFILLPEQGVGDSQIILTAES
jgi:hypothetical protein